MQLMQFFAVRADTGAALPFARVTVYFADSNTKVALFNASGSPTVNPTVATATGQVSVAVPDGTFDIVIQSADGAYTAPTMRQQLVDLQQLAVALTASFGSGRYGSTSAALADSGLANGKLFSVIPSATPNALEDVYQKVSGSVATFQGAIPSFAGLSDTVAAIQRASTPCNQTGGTGNAIVLAPKAGFVVPTGSELRFSWAASAANTGAMTADVTPVTGGDARQIRMPGDVLQVPPGLIQAGALCEIVFKTSGRWELVLPQAALSTVIPLVQINTSATSLQCQIAPGVIPHPTAPLRYVLAAQYPRGTAETGVTLEIEGFNTGDPRQVTRTLGAQIEDSAWDVGDQLTFQFLPTGSFLLTEPLAKAILLESQVQFTAAANAITYAQLAAGN